MAYSSGPQLPVMTKDELLIADTFHPRTKYILEPSVILPIDELIRRIRGEPITLPISEPKRISNVRISKIPLADCKAKIRDITIETVLESPQYDVTILQAGRSYMTIVQYVTIPDPAECEIAKQLRIYLESLGFEQYGMRAAAVGIPLTLIKRQPYSPSTEYAHEQLLQTINNWISTITGQKTTETPITQPPISEETTQKVSSNTDIWILAILAVFVLLVLPLSLGKW